MMVYSLLVIGAAVLIGVGVVLSFYPQNKILPSELLLAATLGSGLGLGATSTLFFLSSLYSANPIRITVSVEALIAALIVIRLWHRRSLANIDSVSPLRGGLISLPPLFLLTIFAQAFLFAVLLAGEVFLRHPHGEWDAWAIYAMHAKFMLAAGQNWPRVMAQPQLAWSHTDYPLLVAASIARGWAYIGKETPIVPWLVSILFAFSTIALLVVAVAQLRNWKTALIGGLVLLGTPFFLGYAGGELSDIPVGYFMLAATALIVMSAQEPEKTGHLVFAGVIAGLAAWTKNEGLLFCLVLGFTFGIYSLIRGSLRSFGVFLVAAICALVPVVYFKVKFAPPNDIMADQGWIAVAQLFNGDRHRIILSFLHGEILRCGEWQFCPFLIMGLFLVGPSWQRWRRAECVAPVVLFLMFVGYYCIYLITPNDLRWHLETSLNRLLLQLWPLCIFVWCLTAPQWPATALNGFSWRVMQGRGWLGCWIIANLSAAILVTALLFRR